jgi:hypothetical protein
MGMEWPVFFPNVKKRSTKDLILRLLTGERSLTNQQIFNRIKKHYGISIAYQSVRQALVELAKTGVLAKDGRDYHISTTWIHSLHEYSTLLHKKYVVKQEIRIVDEQTKEIKIHSMYELGHFVLYGLREHFFGEGELYLLHRHLWTVFFNKEKRRVLAEFFAQQKNSFFVAKKSVGDRLFAAYYRRFGKVKLGKSFDEFFDYVIQGDCVAKIHMPEELRHRMDKLYAMRNPFSIKTIDEYSALHYDDYPITVIITRDQGLANDLRKKIRA